MSAPVPLPLLFVRPVVGSAAADQAVWELGKTPGTCWRKPGFGRRKEKQSSCVHAAACGGGGHVRGLFLLLGLEVALGLIPGKCVLAVHLTDDTAGLRAPESVLKA